ncbi:amino acid/polyamine transporter I [Truncatella angustata]|uniref:Amino acid/polyamine transporter I n=1 Tax=Truncatella angustata TaxID=152316 RepID=A0A9P8ZZT4_9PEZI|nr:amino acid/polyamine transporter I [Truncatella angustata]KAH6657602.1 amino acid/polyamine transporter I [Truncatella angustata]KAH8204531.1 hypothetical protein TruAng_001305 [Truncatella angustata]
MESVVESRHHTVGEDAAALEHLGHKQELKRNFSMISMLGLAFAILNTWTALAASISLALPSGGPSSVVWGLIVAGCCNLCLAASLAEFLSAYPTAGGQYHWAAIIAWKRWSRGISYVTGWINVSGWVALTATGGLLGSTFVLNVIALFNENYEAKTWHQFLIYLAFNVVALVVNVFANRLLPLVTKAAFYWSVAGFIIISITLFSCASPNFQSGSFVYGSFINEVGWPDGLAWMLGLLQGAFALTGFDGVAHMIEEIPNPHIQGPRIMLYCIGIGMVSGFFFLSCLLFVLKDVDTVIDSASGPLLQIFMDATNNMAGSTCLLMFPLVCMLFTTTSILATSSRMSYAFARDRGLPFSSVLAKVHPTLDVPVNALLWTQGWVVIFGLIFLGSSSTFNAITAASVVALGVTYAIPPAINCLRGRRMLPETRAFKLPNAVGWLFNIVGICWTLLTTVLFVFPPETPVTSENMNYCIAAFGVILLIAVTTWIFDGRKHYVGPKMDIDGMLHGKVEGMEPVGSAQTAPEEDIKT